MAICGNPNSGKTTVFNVITGMSQKVGNYPGVTVEKVYGRFSVGRKQTRQCTVVDIPGAYSLSAFSPDEYIAASALFGTVTGEPAPDVVVCVVDSTVLERSLYFLLQVLQIGRPVVVVLNMTDVAKRRGLLIDSEQLSRALGGVPVVPMVGNRGVGVDRLKSELARILSQGDPTAFEIVYDDTTQAALADLAAMSADGRPSRAECLRVLFDVGGPAERAYIARSGAVDLDAHRAAIRAEHGSLTMAETTILTNRAAEIFSEAVQSGMPVRGSFSNHIDRFLLHPVLGPIVLLLIMTFVFQFIFSGAAPVMDVIDSMLASLAGRLATVIPAGPLQSLVADGVVGGVGAVLAFVPQITILFLFISVLEDSGYMTRAAFLVDRMFSWCGLSGKSFIPMLSAFACAVPGILATRTIEDRKLRFITIMVAPFMTCSARLPVYAIMIAAFIPYRSYYGIINLQGLVLGGLYLLGIAVAVIASFVLSRLLFRTERGTFMMEMPSYKLPIFRSVVIRVLNRLKSFLLRAGTVIFAITVIAWALSYYPRSSAAVTELESRVEATQVSLASEREALMGYLRYGIETQPDEVAGRLATLVGTTEVFQNQAEVESVFVRWSRQQPWPETLSAGMQSRRERFEVLLRQRQQAVDDLAGERVRGSYFGHMGRAIEPAFRPLGWDWKITMAVLASFPAREVVIAVLGTVYNLGTDVEQESSSLIDKMRKARWEEGRRKGQRVFSTGVALSITVFFALSCMCGATVMTIRQETRSWALAVLVFAYMTGLAYVASLATYQLLGGMSF